MKGNGITSLTAEATSIKIAVFLEPSFHLRLHHGLLQLCQESLRLRQRQTETRSSAPLVTFTRSATVSVAIVSPSSSIICSTSRARMSSPRIEFSIMTGVENLMLAKHLFPQFGHAGNSDIEYGLAIRKSFGKPR